MAAGLEQPDTVQCLCATHATRLLSSPWLVRLVHRFVPTVPSKRQPSGLGSLADAAGGTEPTVAGAEPEAHNLHSTPGRHPGPPA